MTVVGKYFAKSFLALHNKELDWLSDTMKASLHAVGYVPNQDTHDYKDDLSNEIAGSGYTAGGQNLSGKTISYNAGTKKITLDCDDLSWAASSLSAVRVVVFYDDTPGTDATKPLLCYQVSDIDVGSAGGTFDVIIAAAGLAQITVA
jgi:hypothetical protein